MMSHYPAKPVRGFYNTLCDKPLARCNVTYVRSSVTCKDCLKAMEANDGTPHHH